MTVEEIEPVKAGRLKLRWAVMDGAKVVAVFVAYNRAWAYAQRLNKIMEASHG